MTKCKIDGCDRDAMYKADQVCQKHYFRKMRNGSYHLERKTKKSRLENPAGYQLIYKPDHQLSQANGYVYEHRYVAFQKYGENLPNCEICGNATSWDPYTTHIDHIDENVKNNNPDNLRPLCNSCNVTRSRKPPTEWERSSAIEFEGKVDTAHGWSRDERVSVGGRTIRARIKDGWSIADALFTPSKTVKKKAA